MSFKQIIELAELLDDGRVTGEDVVRYIKSQGDVEASCVTVQGDRGTTDFVKFLIPGKQNHFSGILFCPSRVQDGHTIDLEIYLDDSFPIQDIFCYKIKKGGKNATDKIRERNDNLI